MTGRPVKNQGYRQGFWPLYFRDIGLPQQFKIDVTASDLKKYAVHRLVAQKL